MGIYIYPINFKDYKYTSREKLEERKKYIENTINSLTGKRSKEKKESLKRFLLYSQAINQALNITKIGS